VLRRNRGEEADKSADRPQQVYNTDTTHHKNQVRVKMTTRSLRSQKELEVTKEVTAINVEIENSLMSGGEVNNLELRCVSGGEQQEDLGQNREKTCSVGFWK